jgi:mono/diheme cytochrome c family protein
LHDSPRINENGVLPPLAPLPACLPLPMKLRALLCFAVVCLLASFARAEPATPAAVTNFFQANCLTCHDRDAKEAGLDLTALQFQLDDATAFETWVKILDRVNAGEMPPAGEPRPKPEGLKTFANVLHPALADANRQKLAAQGRAVQRRLTGSEYEYALRDLLSAPWLQVKDQFPEDGEAKHFNKVGTALDVSHVHIARYMTAADYALKQALSVKFQQPATRTERHYARDQRSLTKRFTPNPFNSSPDRMTYPVLGSTAQPEVRFRQQPLTVGDKDPATRELEAVGWVSSNYVTGFTYQWDRFRAPVAGRYRVRFSAYTLWAEPGGNSRSFANDKDKVGKPRPPNANVPDYDKIQPGRTEEPITVYTRNGLKNRRVGSFDITPEPAVYDIGEVWLLANESLVPDASRFYRSRPSNFKNPLMTKEGAPSVAFRWMEVEGPLYDDATTAGYRMLFGGLPLVEVKRGEPGIKLQVVNQQDDDEEEDNRQANRNRPTWSEVTVDVATQQPEKDAELLLRQFLTAAYRKPAADNEVRRFLKLIHERRAARLSFAESMLAGYTAVLASPAFVFLNEQPGKLSDAALATRLSLFLWNSTPDAALQKLAAKGELKKPAVLRAETERMLNDPKAARFVEGFLDQWLDLRKLEDSTPSTTLYNDYYLDESLTEAAQLEPQLYFTELLRKDLPARLVMDSDFTYLNERLAKHYEIDGVRGVAMRRVPLPPQSTRGGFMTMASILKITANGTTTSPVLRGKWIMERILGDEVPPPPPVAAVEPDIRGAVTIREQLAKHRDHASCAACHRKMDPPGFALESFDVLGAWRTKYRGVADDKPAVSGIGKNGHAFAFHYGLPVDAAGELPDGRKFADVREFKALFRGSEEKLATNLVKQLLIYATGSAGEYTDREEIARIVQASKLKDHGVRTLVHEIVQSPLFLNK